MPGFGSSRPSATVPDPYSARQTPINADFGGRRPEDAYAQGYTFDPVQNQYIKTPVQRATEIGQALQALQSSSGLNLLGSSSGAGGSGAGAGAGVGALPPVEFPDTSAARAAAFARGKDTAGQLGRASIDALRGEMAGRGLLGSGIEGSQTRKLIEAAGRGPAEINREQAIQDADAAEKRAALEYQGRIQQRAQDIDVAQANAARQYQSLQGLLEVLGGARGLLY